MLSDHHTSTSYRHADAQSSLSRSYQPPDSWSEQPRPNASRAGRLGNKPASRAGPRGHPYAQSASYSQSPSDRGKALQSGATMDPMRGSIPGPSNRVSDSANQGQELVVASSDDAAIFFQSMSHVLASTSQTGDMLSPNQRPPPAGMRGALSWGVGPNAYENDGRPGTRGGGTAFDLEGRPLTRSGMRPASRMQQLGPGRPTTGAQQVPPSAGAQQSYAAVTGSGGSLATRMSTDFSGMQLRGATAAAAPSQMSGGLAGAHAHRRPGTHQQQSSPHPPDPWNQSEQTNTPLPPSRGGRSTILQPLNVRPVPSGSSQSKTGPSPQSRGAPLVTRPSGGAPGRGGHAPNIFKVEEEGDVDAFLANLSDDEVDSSASLDDLKSYLKTLDQDKALAAAGGSSGRQGQDATGGKGKAPSGRAKEAPKQETPEEKQRRAQRQKTVKMVTRILDVLIEQAVKTSEVNAIIAAAEAKALADEAQHGVVLSEHGWDRQVREALGAKPADDFGGLMSSVASSGSKVPTGKAGASSQAQKQQQESSVLSVPMPEDDFRHVSTRQVVAGKATAPLQPLARGAGGARAPAGSLPAVAGGMARYHHL